MWSSAFCLLSSVIITSEMNIEDSNDERERLLREEQEMMLGNDIVLSDSEIKANKLIMDLKFHELDKGFLNPKNFNVCKHFFEYKDDVKKTKLFKLIQMMPKGAVLHAHDTGILSSDYILGLTYWDNLYICFEEDDIRLQFSANTPKSTCGAKWQLLKEVRNSSKNIEKFDADLMKHFTLVIKNPNEVYTDVNAVWHKFQKYFISSESFFTYKPVWEKYFYDSLKALKNDNVMYLEIRSVLPSLYDLEGNVYDSVATAEVYKKIVDKFLIDYPDFLGVKLIYAPIRMVDANTLEGYINIALDIKRKLPNFLAGFDLVGQEDLGPPLKDFFPQFLAAGKELDYYFHAGETNWYGTSSDENLIDAILLNTKRIGHAFALAKHPLLIKEVKKRKIALEINVLSNSVLKLVDDVRNHPLAGFLAQDLPVVISSDDPGVWGAEPLSHDFYVAFVGVASRHADLRLLKKLALNSLYYNSYPNKDKLVHEFEMRWTKFIDSVVKDQW